MTEEKKPISKIVGKIELQKKPERRNVPLKQNLGELLKQAMEKAKRVG